jgi:hypothetical protein
MSPLTRLGRRIKRKMEKEYGKDKGDQVFYASENSGKLKGVTLKGRRRKR